MLDPRTYWWISRSTGIIAWAVLTLSVIWGLALTTRLLGKFPKPAWMLDLHRHFASLASILVVVHVVSLMLDGYARFSLGDILIPMHTQWKPGPVAWGIVSLYVLIAVQGTSLGKRHLPLKVWRMLHFLSYPLWALATAHFITAGTDAYDPPFAYIVIGTTILISALTMGRVLSPRAPRVPTAASAAASASPVSVTANETTEAKKSSTDKLPKAKATTKAAPGSRAEMIAKARAQAATAKTAEQTPPADETISKPEVAASAASAATPVREDLVERARAAAAAANAGESDRTPSTSKSSDDLIARAREAAAIELARRAADLGPAAAKRSGSSADEVIDLASGAAERISPTE